MKIKKKSKLELAQDEAQAAIDKTNKRIKVLGLYTNILYNKLTDIQECFDKIRNVPNDKILEYNEIKTIQLNWKRQVEEIKRNYDAAAVKSAGAGVAGTGAGVAVVAMGPTVAMGVATTFGVASTGTAISTLSGAAATNAALAWLGGGALVANGGGMAAGSAFLALAGPVGWSIAGVSLVASGIILLKTKDEQKRIENIFTDISKRDVKSYNLAIVEINERIVRILDESEKLQNAMLTIKTFGLDYNKMTEQQQYELGAYVNLMAASTQLLVNPIKGLQPKFSEKDYNEYVCWIDKKADNELIEPNKDLIIYLANLLYKSNINSEDEKLLWKMLRKNKKMLESMNTSKEKFDIEVMDAVLEALNYKYVCS